jgi:hypothetical protein
VTIFAFGLASVPSAHAGTEMITDNSAPVPRYEYAPPPVVYYAPPPVQFVVYPGYGYYGGYYAPRFRGYGYHRFYGHGGHGHGGHGRGYHGR